MKILNAFGVLFLLPGTLMLSMLNIPVEKDGGVFRSMFNMLFWGFVCVLGAIPFMFG